MTHAAITLFTVVVLLLGGLWFFQRHLIYFPSPRGLVPPVDTQLPEARDVRLVTEDGLRLHASFLPPREPDGVVVLIANGNGGDRTGRAPLARALAARGFGVLLFDYRGYGNNPGTPSEAGVARDARAARQFLVDEAAVRPDRLVYFGESLGSAVVTALAVRHPPAGLVLRSPFVDLASVGSAQYPFLPVRLLLRDRYRLAAQLREVHVPVTVVYGGADSLIPPAQSRAVAATARNLRQLVKVDHADHNDPSLVHGHAVVAAIVDMAEAVTAQQP